jgi:hypothetical protein
LGAGIGACATTVVGVGGVVLVGGDVVFADELHAAVMDVSATLTTSIERNRLIEFTFVPPGFRR